MLHCDFQKDLSKHKMIMHFSRRVDKQGGGEKLAILRLFSISLEGLSLYAKAHIEVIGKSLASPSCQIFPAEIVGKD